MVNALIKRFQFFFQPLRRCNGRVEVKQVEVFHPFLYLSATNHVQTSVSYACKQILSYTLNTHENRFTKPLMAIFLCKITLLSPQTVAKGRGKTMSDCQTAAEGRGKTLSDCQTVAKGRGKTLSDCQTVAKGRGKTLLSPHENHRDGSFDPLSYKPYVLLAS